MGFISLICYKSYIFFLAFWIIDIFASLIKYYSTEIKIEKDFIATEQFIVLFSYCISDSLAGFLVLITNKLIESKKNEKIGEKYKGYFELIYNENNDKTIKKNQLLLLILMCLIDFFGRAVSLIYYLIFDDDTICKESNNTFLIHIDIICRIIFSKLILKYKIHRHHWLSIIILIIGFISMFYAGFALLEDNINNCYYIIFFVLKRMAFSLGDVFTKIIFNTELILPQSIMFAKGISAFLIHIFIFFPLIFFKKELIPFSKGDNNYFQSFTPFDIFIKIIFIFLLFLRNIVILHVIYIFSPTHLGFLDIIIIYLDYIPSIIKFRSFHTLMYFISLIIIIFGTLLFNEIIIINKYGLNKYTKPAIIKRMRLEKMSLESEIEMGIEEEEEEEEEENENETLDAKVEIEMK